MITRLISVWLFMGLMLFAFTGMAGETSQAKKAFNKGAALFEKEKYMEAATQFRKAYELRPNWKLLYNIGQCEAAARNYALALELFEAYLVQGGDNIDMTRSQDLLAEIERLKKLVGYLDIKGAPVGVEVIVNTDSRGKTPLLGPLAITASIKNRVVLQKDGEVLYERSFKVHSGQTATIDLAEKASGAGDDANNPEHQTVVSDLSDDAAPPEDNTSAVEPTDDVPPTVDLKRYKRLKIAGWITFGAGAGALIASAITGSIAYSKKMDLEPQCDGECTGNLRSEQTKMENLGRATDVLIISGATVAVTGMVILIVAKSKEKKANRDLALAPIFQPGAVGLSIKGEF